MATAFDDMYDATHCGDNMQSYYDTMLPSVNVDQLSYSNSSGSDVGSGYHFNAFAPHHAALHDAVDSSRWTASSYTAYDPLRQLQQAQLLYAQQHAPPGSVYPETLQAQHGTIGQAMSAIDVGTSSMKPSSPSDVPAGLPSTRRPSFGDDPLGDVGGSSKTKPFITKLAHLVDTPSEYRDCIVWDESGTSFIICHSSSRLLQEVLPKFFGHSNIHSFTRQLNVYGFTRMSQLDLADKLATNTTSDYSGWSHPHFLRDDKSMLQSLTPKPSKARMQKKLEKQERLKREEQQRREQHLAKAHAHTQANLAQIGLPGVAASGYPVPPKGTLFFDYSGAGRRTRQATSER